jgi:hypothetical protein
MLARQHDAPIEAGQVLIVLGAAFLGPFRAAAHDPGLAAPRQRDAVEEFGAVFFRVEHAALLQRLFDALFVIPASI